MVGGMMMVNKVIADNRAPKAWHFRRGLSPEFISALKALAADQKSWFRDILVDPELTLCIRKDYLNVYVDGQSLFQIDWNTQNKEMYVTTHPKYLVDPALKKPVVFDGGEFHISSIKPLAESYEKGKTLARMKTAARIYSGIEKEGVQKVFRANAKVVDLEIALSKSADREDIGDESEADGSATAKNRAKAKRIDIACFEEIDKKIHLCFWEAKDYGNAELWASGNASPPVVDQVSGYKELIGSYRCDIKESYRTVAKNLVCLAKMADREDQLGKLIKRVADGEDFFVDCPPKVGVVLFGFSEAERRGDRHKLMLKKLQREGLAVVARGKPGGMTLKWNI
jgi:hypothetical protein